MIAAAQIDQRVAVLAYLGHMAAGEHNRERLAAISSLFDDDTLESIHHDHFNGRTHVSGGGDDFTYDWKSGAISTLKG